MAAIAFEMKGSLHVPAVPTHLNAATPGGGPHDRAFPFSELLDRETGKVTNVDRLFDDGFGEVMDAVADDMRDGILRGLQLDPIALRELLRGRGQTDNRAGRLWCRVDQG